MGVAVGVKRRVTARRGSAALAALCAVAGSALAPGAASAQSLDQPSLVLSVGYPLEVGKPAPVRATGTAPSELVLSVFVDPLGAPCPEAAAERPGHAIVIAPDTIVVGAFSVGSSYEPDRKGPQTACAYLGPTTASSSARAAQEGFVNGALLRAAVARHTVPTSLRRHGFAKRVVDAVKQRCRRRARDEFRCRFEVHFRGYDLTGAGRVTLTADGVSYRFRVVAQEERFVLTDRNEERA
jgi:hypothetical protein